MTTFVDVQLIDGLGLPYAPGAEAGSARRSAWIPSSTTRGRRSSRTFPV